MPTWYTTADEGRILDAWPDAPIENLEVLGFILDTARMQVLDYAPALAPATQVAELLTTLGAADKLDAVLAVLELPAAPEPPFNLVLAQLQQAINLWNAGRVSSSGDAGVDGYTFTPRPLDKTIKQIIRPVSGYSHAL
jgi:hypothetical protein